MRIDASVEMSEREDAVQSTHEVLRVQIGHKFQDGETIYRIISIRGNNAVGYMASSEEWFTGEDKHQPEFYEVEFQTSIYDSAKDALYDAIPNAFQEAESAGFTIDIELTDGVMVSPCARIPAQPVGIEPVVVEPVAEEKPITLNPDLFEVTDGYVGSMGTTYTRVSQDKLNAAVRAAELRNGKSNDEIVQMLLDGKPVTWCNSPNHYYDHGVGYIRRKRVSQPVELVRCSCGHSVPRSQVMSASLGTSCPDCYDDMSG